MLLPGAYGRNPSSTRPGNAPMWRCPGTRHSRKGRHDPLDPTFSFAGKKPIVPSLLALFFILIFTGGITLAKSTGNWQNGISKKEYLSYIAPVRNTFRSLDRIDPEKMQKMILMMKRLKEQQGHMRDLQKQKGERK